MNCRFQGAAYFEAPLLHAGEGRGEGGGLRNNRTLTFIPRPHPPCRALREKHSVQRGGAKHNQLTANAATLRITFSTDAFNIK